MDGLYFLREGKKIQNELTKDRRYLHKNAETGFEIPKTKAYLVKRLEKMGVKTKTCGRSGVVASIGKTSKKGAFLLRADVDALPIAEETGEPFACTDGHMHACGHDLHAAMLLGAAKLLKSCEKELKGEIRLLFQPAEEILEGAKDCVKDGVLDGVTGAMMLHVLTALPMKSGELIVSSAGVSAPAADYFTVKTFGKGCHGASPQNGVDAALITAKTLLGLQEIVARELPPNETAALTVGRISSGSAANAIADVGTLEGTLRCFTEKIRAFIKKRIAEIAQGIAKSYRGKAEIVFTSGCPTLVNDKKLSEFALKRAEELIGERAIPSSAFGEKKGLGGSEDFAYIAKQVPAVMVGLTAGEAGKGYGYPLHHPKARFDESALSVGAAYLAYVAFSRFEDK